VNIQFEHRSSALQPEASAQQKARDLPGAHAPADAPFRALLDAASQPYRKAGRFAYKFARGKLGVDPVYRAILELGLLQRQQRILDLGCGQALLAAWLAAAARCYEVAVWPRSWPPPSRGQSVRGIELMPSDVARAHRALGSACDVIQADIRSAAFGAADAVVILDVLHYLDAHSQCDVLERVHAALPPGGLLLLRVGNPADGLRFRITAYSDKLAMFFRGHGIVATHCRSIEEWRELLTECGFDSEATPMSRGTPFANVLLTAHAR
jgi:SAM-dependent methyltransferase